MHTHTPAEIAFIKSELIDRVRQGQKLRPTAATFGVDQRMLTRWRREDAAFNAALATAHAEKANQDDARKAAQYSAHYAGVRASELQRIRDALPHLIAVEGVPLTRAIDKLGVAYTLLTRLRRENPDFDQAITDAMIWQTEKELDRLKNLHEEIRDAKLCNVASNNLMRWLELRNKNFRPKAEPADSNPDLVTILRAAVNRLIDAVPPATPSLPVIELKPDPVTEARAQMRMSNSENEPTGPYLVDGQIVDHRRD